MSTGYHIDRQDAVYYLTFQVVEWIDLFSRQIYRDLFLESLRYCQKHKALEVYAFVIMSNHVHLLVRSGIGDLSGTIRSLKSYTAKSILRAIEEEPESRRDWMLKLFALNAEGRKRNERYQLWTHENHAEEIYSNRFVDQKIMYIHQNPVRGGIVKRAENYLYSSARNYAGEAGVLDVVVTRSSVGSCRLYRTIR